MIRNEAPGTELAIGFIGLGDMGVPMAERLLDTGHALTVWNRTTAKAAPLLERGARRAETPADLFATCDIVGLCLTSDRAVGEIVEDLFAPGARSPRTIVDFSTGAPEAAVRFAERARACGIGWVDAPVSGGVPAARTGSLTLFLGGHQEDIDAAAPLLEAVSGRRTVMGGPGAGQTAKLCNQMIVSCTMLVIAETIATAARSGVDVTRLPEALRDGFADSGPLRIFGPRMALHEHEPRLGAIALMVKDLGLARAMADAAGARVPLAEFCSGLYAQAADPEADLSRLIDLFER